MLMLGPSLTYTYGGARAFGYLVVNVSAIRAFRTGDCARTEAART
jgi:hypothetical protein